MSEKAQLELIRIAIHYPEHIKDINVGLFTNSFLHDVMKAIANNKGKSTNQAQLLHMIGGDEEERNLIVSLAIKGHRIEDKDQILKDCLLILEQEPIKKKIQLLRDKIRRIEESGSSPDESLITELNNLQKKLK